MRVRFPLYAQIVSVLLLNLLVLVGIFLVFFESGFAPGLDALIRGPVGDQIQAVGWAINRHVASIPRSGWNQVLNDYGKTYGAKFYVFGIDGDQVAGDSIKLPEEIRQKFEFDRMHRHGMHEGFFIAHHEYGQAQPDAHHVLIRVHDANGGPVLPEAYPSGQPPEWQQGHPPDSEPGHGPEFDQGHRPDLSPGSDPGHREGPPPEFAQGHRPDLSSGSDPEHPHGPPPEFDPGHALDLSPGSDPVHREGPPPEFRLNPPPGPGPRTKHHQFGRSEDPKSHAHLTMSPQLPFGPREGGPATISIRTAVPQPLTIRSNGGYMPPPPFAAEAFVIGSDGPDSHMPPLPPPLGQPFLVHTHNPNCYWLGTFFPLDEPDLHRNIFFGPHGRPGILIATTPNLLQSKLGVNLGFLNIIVLVVFGVSILIWSPFAYRVTRSLGDLNNSTKRIAEGNFDVKLADGNWDELKRLASSINVLSNRLNNFILGQRRFLGDIAHELCSPISRLQIALALLEESNSDRHPAIIRDIRDEVSDMSTLIQELLSFSKASLRGQQVQLVPVAIAPMIQSIVDKIGSSASFVVEVHENIYALGDETLLHRAVANVLRNSVRYASEFGPIDITAKPVGSNITITVLDRGPGVPPEALELLGEPFYRPEPSRDRNTGGAGLGLAIVKTCVETCGGTLQVQNRTPQGLVVTMTLQSAERDEQAVVAGSDPVITADS